MGELNFETALAKLEQIVRELEAGELSLRRVLEAVRIGSFLGTALQQKA